MPTEINDYEDYNKASESYDKSGRTPICIERIINRLPMNCSILDAGCGTGNYILPLIRSRKITSYTAIEVNEGMLNVAKRKSNSISPEINVRIQKGNLLTTLDFDDNTFDAVIINQVLHHLTDVHKPTRKEQIENVQHVFNECRRVLKDGGVLCINTSSHAQNRALWYVSLLLPGDKVSKVLNRFPDISEMKEMLHYAGFKNVEAEVDTEPMLGESYHDYEKAFEASYRNAESTFALVTSEELEASLIRLKEFLKDRDSYDKKVRSDRQREGCSTELFAT